MKRLLCSLLIIQCLLTLLIFNSYIHIVYYLQQNSFFLRCRLLPFFLFSIQASINKVTISPYTITSLFMSSNLSLSTLNVISLVLHCIIIQLILRLHQVICHYLNCSLFPRVTLHKYTITLLFTLNNSSLSTSNTIFPRVTLYQCIIQ